MPSQLYAFLLCLYPFSLLQAQVPGVDFWYLEDINLPSPMTVAEKSDPLLIAIVDDGMRLSHQDIDEFIWVNSLEVAGNRIDEDGNGYVDDYQGFDVSDNDGDVSIPSGRADYNHGTHLAGIIARIATQVFGEQASNYIQLLPVKSLSDRAEETFLKEAYLGVRYAIDAGADIILAAWGMDSISPYESELLREAADKDILVIASGGNFAEEKEQFPAAHESVLAIGASTRDGKKRKNSNYGAFLDLSAPGEDIWSASVSGDRDYDSRSGSSFSAAIVTAAAAVLKLQFPDRDNNSIKACLKSSADAIPVENFLFSAKTGAGKLNLAAAVQCRLLLANTSPENHFDLPEAFIAGRGRGRNNELSWTIAPEGEFNGLRFHLAANDEPRARGQLDFYAGAFSDSELVGSYALDELPASIFVPGHQAHIQYTPGSRRRFDWILEYEADPIDFGRLYCDGVIQIDSEGELEDGSGEGHYSPNSNCKWLLVAPPGKRIQFNFDQMDTEGNTDILYFFDGELTNAPIMAAFSGNSVPPELTTWRNHVLLWFVSDTNSQGQGWHTVIPPFLTEAASRP